MNNKVIAMTGGNSGIGKATVDLFRHQGYKVAIFAQSVDRLNTMKLENPDQISIYSGDIRSTRDIECFYDECVKRWGGIDVVVANAGIAIPETLSEVSEDSFMKTVDINVKGVFFTVQKSLRYLRPKASIILISSIRAQKGAGMWAVYGASKAAVRALSRSFAQELGIEGVRVNTISPGVTQTPILNKFGFDSSKLNTILSQVKSSTPLGRLGTPNEIAQAILFLLSESASFINGADIQVDGGLAQI